MTSVWIVLTGEYRVSDLSYIEGVFLSLEGAKAFAEKAFNAAVADYDWVLSEGEGVWDSFEMGIALTYMNCYWYVLEQKAQP